MPSGWAKAGVKAQQTSSSCTADRHTWQTAPHARMSVTDSNCSSRCRKTSNGSTRAGGFSALSSRGVGVAAADGPRLLSHGVTFSEPAIPDDRNFSIRLPLFQEGKGIFDFPLVARSAGPEPLDLCEWESGGEPERPHRCGSLSVMDGGTAHGGVPDFPLIGRGLDLEGDVVFAEFSLRSVTFGSIASELGEGMRCFQF